MRRRGFSDSLGLAALSYGWQGRIALDQKDYIRATRFYLLHDASGDPLAAWSLRDTASAVLAAGPAALKDAANDPHTRRVVTALVVASPSMNYGQSPFKTNQIIAWLAAVEANSAGTLESADRLAWIAYQHNLYADADRCLNRGELTPLGHWVAPSCCFDPASSTRRPPISPRHARFSRRSAMAIQLQRHI